MAKDGLELGERELDIMGTLWELRSATIGEVHAGLRTRGIDVAYTTVQTMLNRLEAKGIVARERREQSYKYRPIMKRSRAVGNAIRRIADRFFHDSAEDLVVHLVENGLDDTQLERLQKLIDDKRDAMRK